MEKLNNAKNKRNEREKYKKKSNKYKDVINHNIIESLNEQEKLTNLPLLKSTENLANNKWINYKFNSCRYDSFFFIYCNVIYPYIRDMGKTSYIISLDKMRVTIISLEK